MKIEFIFSAENEVCRIKDTLKKNGFYNKNGYKILLPEGISENSSEEEIKNAVLKEWDETFYKKAKQEIGLQWEETADLLKNGLKKTKFIPCKEYEVTLTKYGVGGSYNLPNTIVLNILKQDGTAL
jgi:hypothetical protein